MVMNDASSFIPQHESKHSIMPLGASKIILFKAPSKVNAESGVLYLRIQSLLS